MLNFLPAAQRYSGHLRSAAADISFRVVLQGSSAAGSASTNRSFIQLNRELMNTTGLAALVHLIDTRVDEFNQVNATTALQRLAKAGAGAAEQQVDGALRLLVARTAELLARPVGGAWEPRQLSTAMWALARLRLAANSGAPAGYLQLFDALVAAAMPVAVARRFRPQEMANSVWALARLDHRPQRAPALLTALADGAAAQAREFTAQGLSNTVWGMATLGFVHAGLMTAVAAVVRHKMAEFNTQEVSNTLWAFAKLEPRLRGSTAERAPYQVLQAVNAVLVQLLDPKPRPDGGLTEQHLANLAWAVAHISDRGDADAPLHSQASESAASATVDFPALFVKPIAERANACNPRELAMVAWAAATAATGEAGAAAVSPALNAIGTAVLSILSVSQNAGSAEASFIIPLSPGQLSTFVWAFARLRIQNAALMDAVGREVRPTLNEFGWHDLSLLLWAYARLQHKMPKLMLKAARSIHRRLKQEMKATKDHPAKGKLGRLPEAATSQLLGDMDSDGPAPAFEGQCSLSSSPTLATPRHLATLIWSFGTLEVYDDKLVRSVAAASLSRLQEFSPRDMANMAWGFATLSSIGPSNANNADSVQELMRGLAQNGGARMADFTAQESSQFLWACEKAGVADEPTLDVATRQRRERTFAFPALTHVDPLSSTDGNVTIAWQPAGRGLAHTGLAPWDASYVLAEWMSRHPCPASAPALQQFLCGNDGNSTCTRQQWGGRHGVELGAGVGLLSIVAARLGVSMVATDGDDAVLDLLRENVNRQQWSETQTGEEHVRVRQLKWGAPDVLDMLGLTAPAGLILATGVVYGGDPEGWAGLVDTMVQLSDRETLVLLAHGQGAAPGLHRTEGPFFDRVAVYFEYTTIPLHTLHPSYRRSGCVIHALRRRLDLTTPDAIRTTNGCIAALDGQRGKRAKRKRAAVVAATRKGSVPREDESTRALNDEPSQGPKTKKKKEKKNNNNNDNNKKKKI